MTRDHEDRFDHFADRYEDTVAGSLPIAGGDTRYFADRKTRLLSRVVPLSGAQRLLDFGCGIGVLTQSLLTRIDAGGQVLGLDVSEGSIDEARLRIGDTRAEFACVREHVLPAPPNSFDGIVAACVFHHIERRERASWMRELLRVCRPGGWVAIFEHNPFNPLTRAAVDRCPFDEGVELLRPSESSGLLQDAGFVDVRITHYLFVPPQLDWLVPAERLLTWLPIGGQYLAFGRRRPD